MAGFNFFSNSFHLFFCDGVKASIPSLFAALTESAKIKLESVEIEIWLVDEFRESAFFIVSLPSAEGDPEDWQHPIRSHEKRLPINNNLFMVEVLVIH